MIVRRARSFVKDDQHILRDRQSIGTLVGKADLKSTDVVLEIGGGPGNISSEIIKHCGRLIVVEKDPKFSAYLADRFRGNQNVLVLPGDVLKVRLPAFNKIVASTPFSILQQFFMRLIREGRQNFEQAVLIVPYAFAKKMTAGVDSKYFGAISALFMAFYDVEIFAQIDKSKFDPPPRVTSVCVSIRSKDRSSPQFGNVQRILQSMFVHDEKEIKNVIMQTLWDAEKPNADKPLTKKKARALTNQIVAGLPEALTRKKAIEMTNEEFGEMAAALLEWAGD